MNIFKFINDWAAGVKMLITLCAISIIIFAVFSVFAILVITIMTIPEHILTAAMVVVFIIFGPWAVSQTYPIR